MRHIAAVMTMVATMAVAAAPMGTAGEPRTGIIAGSVKFTGEVPPPKKILVTDGSTILHNDLVVDAKTKGLRFVTVMLEQGPAGPAKKKTDTVIVDQRDMVFLPRVVAIQEGQKVRFENSDLANHGVQALSTEKDNTFSVTVGPNQPFDYQFKAQKKPVVIGCQIHAWMRAWVFVLPHPYFAVTDAQGNFRIADVPAGKHTVLFAHPDGGLKEQRTIEVAPGKATEVQIEWKKAGA